MGVDYKQICVLGIEVPEEELLHILSPAQYDEQPRYDTKTGKETHKEKVLVRDEESAYRYMGCESYGIWELGYEIAKKYPLYTFVDREDNALYIGRKIGDNIGGWGRVDLIEDSVSLDKIQTQAKELRDILPEDKEISLHFVTSVG